MSSIKVFCLFFLIYTLYFPSKADSKIVDFTADNQLFHPYVQRMRNHATNDYLIKLLKRNLAEKLRNIEHSYIDHNYAVNNFRNGAEDSAKKCKLNCVNCGCGASPARMGTTGERVGQDQQLSSSEAFYNDENKRCNNCNMVDTKTPSKSETYTCKQEGAVANSADCNHFYICQGRGDQEPLDVSCPRGFAFDSRRKQCTRNAFKKCRELKQSLGIDF